MLLFNIISRFCLFGVRLELKDLQVAVRDYSDKKEQQREVLFLLYWIGIHNLLTLRLKKKMLHFSLSKLVDVCLV